MILRYFKLALAVLLLTLTAFSSLLSQLESSTLSVPHYYIPNDINAANLPVVLVCVLQESAHYTLVNRLYSEARVEVDICHINTDRYDICTDLYSLRTLTSQAYIDTLNHLSQTKLS